MQLVDGVLKSSVRDLAIARSRCSHAILAIDGDFEEAWRLADLAVEALLKTGGSDYLFGALVNKAEAAMATGRLQIAEAVMAAARKLAKDDADAHVFVRLRGHLALTRHTFGEAAELFEEGAQSFLALLNLDATAAEELRATAGIGSCIHNKGLALRAGGDAVGAATAFSRAVEWYRRACSPIDESVSLRFLARCHFDEQEWAFGFETLNRSQDLAEGVGFITGQVECLELRARALATTDQPDEARIALRKVLVLLGDTDDDRRRRCHQMLATLANDAGASDSVGLHLDAARLLAARSGDALKIADVAQQIDEIRKAERGKIRASEAS